MFQIDSYRQIKLLFLIGVKKKLGIILFHYFLVDHHYFLPDLQVTR